MPTQFASPPVGTMPAASLVRQRFSTRSLPAAQRAARWAEVVCSINFSMQISLSTQNNYAGAFRRFAARDFQVVSFREDEARFERTRAHIRGDGNDVYQFLMPLAGICQAEHYGHAAPCAPGHFLLIDSSEPMRITQLGRMAALLFTVSRSVVEDALYQPQRLCGRVLDGRSGIARAGLDLLHSLERQGDHLSTDAFRQASRNVVELILLSVEDALADSTGDSRVRRANLARIRNYVREHLNEPELGTPRVAAGVGLSTRYVQALLKASGTTARDLIRGERLRQAHAMLGKPLYRHRPVTEIAYACGFSHSGHFSTAFREQYGMAPRDYRQQALSTTGAPQD